MSILNRQQNAYAKLGNIDPDELRSRRAQFLIYKGLQKADTRRRKSWLGVKITKLKIKFGKKLKRLRKGFSSSVFGVKVDLCKQIVCVLKSCKYLMYGKQQQIVIRTIPPVF